MNIARSITSSYIMFLLCLSSNTLKISILASVATTNFTFKGFKGNQTEIQTEGVSTIQQDDGLLILTNQNHNVIGTMFYRNPVRLRDDSNNNKVCSFSTSFVFVIIPIAIGNGGFGFTFTLSPTPNRPGAESGQFMGLLNRTNNGNQSNHVFAVEFDTVQGFKDGFERRGNHIGLDFNSLFSDIQEPVVYYDTDDRKEDFELESGEPIRVHVDYGGYDETLNVTMYPTRLGFRPKTPLISRRVSKLLEVVEEEMYVGFTSATGREQRSAHYLMGWSFSSCGESPTADPLDLSQLPPPPKTALRNKKGHNSQIVALVVSLSILVLVFIVLLLAFVMYKRRNEEEDILEDLEIDCPRRFNYKDLYLATQRFKESEIIGSGGFGTVYRGNLSSSGLIAVKKITQDSLQGVREFVAEIESLGRLRHKNLVNLQGWCKHKNDLLLIYDYIPNGSLDAMLYKTPRRSGAILPWDVRFEIIKGIASGLLYLHEEWEQIVIHRDVKASNVLIDADMNAKLGDFGLARLYERGTLTQTTKVVGTLGYMAPELTRNGKGSTASDVFAFGVLMLEIVSGNKPTNSEDFFLADLVMEFHATSGILGAVDQKLGTSFDGREAKLALLVGLLCCHQKPSFRPTMRTVIRYLNEDEDVPNIDGNCGFSDASRDGNRSNVFGYVSSDKASSSNASSSFLEVSSGSLVNGR